MKAIIVARVSTEEQASDGFSLDNQRHKIELYAEINDMELIGIEADENNKHTIINIILLI